MKSITILTVIAIVLTGFACAQTSALSPAMPAPALTVKTQDEFKRLLTTNKWGWLTDKNETVLMEFKDSGIVNFPGWTGRWVANGLNSAQLRFDNGKTAVLTFLPDYTGYRCLMRKDGKLIRDFSSTVLPNTVQPSQ